MPKISQVLMKWRRRASHLDRFTLWHNSRRGTQLRRFTLWHNGRRAKQPGFIDECTMASCRRLFQRHAVTNRAEKYEGLPVI